jgi:hypothetical protein
MVWNGAVVVRLGNIEYINLILILECLIRIYFCPRVSLGLHYKTV